ncbi:DUF4394 domain-containing protein [Yoonia sp. R78084]|uniref:DUF4394 domain-containing protein n=1 Tax=Yoonia sp. R78084 TaxID=3093869 RepID=UPI0037DD56DE
MKKTLISAAALTILAAPAFAAGHASPASGYGLTNDGRTLVMFPGLVEAGASVDLSTPVDAIAYRPVTGDVIGITRDGMVYGIDTVTGAVTAMENTVAPEVMIGADAAMGFDFNNQIDAVRAVTTDGVNLVYFPMGFGDMDARANSVLRFTDLAYAAGDANEGSAAMIFANAYTNAINGMTASETAQYALDAETNALVTLANNAGTLTTVAPITIDGAVADLSIMGGFEIVSPAEGENMAYAILMLEGADTSGLYSIDLTTGEATMMADAGMRAYTGFAAMLPN